MSDTYYGNIKIGGQISHDVARELLESLDNYFSVRNTAGITDDDIENPFTLQCKLFEASRKDDNWNIDDVDFLFFSDTDARNGMFDDLETLLEEKQVVFVRYSSQCYEFPEEMVWFDGRKRCHRTLDGDGNPVWEHTEIKKIIEQYKEDWQAALDKFESQLPPQNSNLPVFSIVT